MPRHRRRTTAAITLVGIIALALTGCSEDGRGVSVDGEDSVRETEVVGQAGPSSFADGVFTSPTVGMRITETRVIAPGEPGNEYGEGPVMAFWYETTNVSGQATDPLTAWLTHFRLSQDAGDGRLVDLTLAMAPAPALMATQTEAVDAGDTVPNAVSYRLDNSAAPVRVLAVDALLQPAGTQDFPLP